MSEWWNRKNVQALEWYNEEWGVGTIVPRHVDGDWEYAFVSWHYQVPNLMFILRAGKKYDENGNEIE